MVSVALQFLPSDFKRCSLKKTEDDNNNGLLYYNPLSFFSKKDFITKHAAHGVQCCLGGLFFGKVHIF